MATQCCYSKQSPPAEPTTRKLSSSPTTQFPPVMLCALDSPSATTHSSTTDVQHSQTCDGEPLGLQCVQNSIFSVLSARARVRCFEGQMFLRQSLSRSQPCCVRAMSKKRISVIVADDLPGLGSKGEVRSVRPGHARNYLFPQKVRRAKGLSSFFV
jgi:hypothetical protein